MSFRGPRVAGAAVLCLLALSGCGLAPVPPPPQTSAAQTRAPASSVGAPAPAPAPAPAVSVSGFSTYERAALRVRNLGCGGVAVGSGFAIADHVFVTNRHVVVGAAVLQVSTYDGADITVNTVGAAVVADLAVVWTKESLPAQLRLAPSNPPVGAEVTAVGYPLGGELTTTNGRVLRYGPDPLGSSPLPMMYNDAPIEHGSSGSPLVDSSGELVGVAYAGGGGQYVAVPVEILNQVLKDPSKFSNGAGCG
ncbi:trypsin-like peptidase domain-containing protein [Arthrobacter bambusae]